MRHTADGNDASLPDNNVPEEFTAENPFAAGIDGRELSLELRLPERNELPIHQRESAFPINQPKYSRIHGRTQIVNGLQTRDSRRRRSADVPQVQFFVGIDRKSTRLNSSHIPLS